MHGIELSQWEKNPHLLPSVVINAQQELPDLFMSLLPERQHAHLLIR